MDVLNCAQAFWIGPLNYQINTPESDAVAKAKSEWVQVHGQPFKLKETDGFKAGAFVCLDVDVRECENYSGTSFEAVIKMAP